MSAATHETILRSATKEVVIGHNRRFCLIGERINPTGRRIFQEQLRAGDLSAIERDVKAQVEGGADVLDVNMGVPLTDEADLLSRAVVLVQEHTDLPLCIDSSVVEALEAGLSVYRGKALVNSVTCEEDRLERVLPLVKEHGAAVICLTNDETGIPQTAAERLEVCKRLGHPQSVELRQREKRRVDVDVRTCEDRTSGCHASGLHEKPIRREGVFCERPAHGG